MLYLNIVDKATQFLRALEADLAKNNICLYTNWRPDHICYRTSSTSNYQDTKNIFANMGALLGETLVNGRPIATYRLYSPFQYQNHEIWLVEVPHPKREGTIESFEHMEIICDCPFETVERMYPQAKWDKGGIHKPYNPELEIVLGERNLKFHHQSLSSVMRLEQNQNVWRALEESEILKSLKPWHPFLTGTYPLGLEVEGSDLDILITLKNRKELKKKLAPLMAQVENVEWSEDTDALFSLSFNFKGVNFDIYGEPTLSYHQKSARHFRIEEKILEPGNLELLDKIKALRKTGLKTEPAFAQALGLTGDPYQSLLEYEN